MNSSGLVCVFSGRGDCEGRLEWHHVIPKQTLKRAFRYGGIWVDGRLVPLGRGAVVPPDVTLDELLGDTRNRAILCSHHHQNVEWKRLYVDPPDDAIRFAVELGLESVLLKARERRAA